MIPILIFVLSTFFIINVDVGVCDGPINIRISTNQNQPQARTTQTNKKTNRIKPVINTRKYIVIRGGFGMGSSGITNEDEDEDLLDEDDDLLSNNNKNGTTIEIRGAPSYIRHIDGLYHSTEWKVNDKPHYEREVSGDPNGDKIHLYFTGNQWVIHYDLDPSRNFANLLAYAKVKESDPSKTTSFWNVKYNSTYEPIPQLDIGRPGRTSQLRSSSSNGIGTHVEEFFGVPKQLFPVYIAFMLDAIAVGLAMPLLPFFVMELGANAMQLSLVVSSNYVAQTMGCIIMGRVSDRYGRKVVLLCCLLASSLSYFFISKSVSLPTVAAARIISGSFGGLIPIMQSSVADVSPVAERPKYIGRIMATFGLGFVLGPALSAILPNFSTREKIQMAALLPLTGFLLSLFFVKESKKDARGLFGSNPKLSKKTNLPKKALKISPSSKESPPIELEVMLLVLNGFLLMYAFATESIYAMFIKDSFGYGERVLSGLFAINGMFIGVFQVFFIKPLINLIGKHLTLALGNSILALGMIGVALIRRENIHFFLFAVHIVGYSIADTALASLISKYSSASSQGKSLALNQSAQSCARVISPIIAGFLYELSKKTTVLPMGALPFLVGAMCPAVAVAIPSLLYIRSVSNKRKIISKQDSIKTKTN